MGNYGKDSSNYPHFFRIVLPHNLQNRSTLELPRKFVRKHSKSLYKYAHLKLPTGAVSKMELKMDKNRAWLSKGWPDFVNKYAIQYGYFLVFKFIGGFCFDVQIYDLTTCEIDYPPLRYDKINLVKVKEAPNQVEKAKPIECNHSCFTVMMRQSYVEFFYKLHIPDAHSQRYLTSENGKEAFLVVDGVEDAQTWPVKIYVHTGTTRFSSGWKDFVMDNSLKRGDFCNFELLSHKPNYYKVTISRVAHESP